jgi:hypothetical protein
VSAPRSIEDLTAQLDRVEAKLDALLALDPSPPLLVDAATLARLLSLDRGWIYANANRLGAVRVGDGARPRLRFDPAVARSALAAPRATHMGPQSGPAPPAPRQRRRGTRQSASGPPAAAEPRAK